MFSDARVAMGDAGAGDAAFSVAADAESADVWRHASHTGLQHTGHCLPDLPPTTHRTTSTRSQTTQAYERWEDTTGINSDMYPIPRF